MRIGAYWMVWLHISIFFGSPSQGHLKSLSSHIYLFLESWNSWAISRYLDCSCRIPVCFKFLFLLSHRSHPYIYCIPCLYLSDRSWRLFLNFSHIPYILNAYITYINALWLIFKYMEIFLQFFKFLVANFTWFQLPSSFHFIYLYSD